MRSDEGDRSEAFAEILREVPAGAGAVITCFFTGTDTPDFLEAMPRSPAPPVGMTFGQDFAGVYSDALALNAAVHDGAVLMGRSSRTEPYKVVGWSMRMFPPGIGVKAEENRGSAYNSCLAMSVVPSVDMLYLASGGELVEFCRGTIRHVVETGPVHPPSWG